MENLHSYYINVSVDNQAIIWERFNGSLVNAKTKSLLLISDIEKTPHQTLRLEISKPGIVKTTRGEKIVKEIVWLAFIK